MYAQTRGARISRLKGKARRGPRKSVGVAACLHTMCTQVYAICGRGGKGARKKTGGYDRPLLIPGYRHCTNMHNYQLLNQLSTVLDWMRFEGNEYFFSTIEMSWYDSRTRCQSLDADLISIASQQEQEFVDQHADYRYVHRTPVDRNKSSCINMPTTGTFTAHQSTGTRVRASTSRQQVRSLQVS